MLTPDSDFALPFPVSMQRNGKTQDVRIVLLPAQLEMVYMISGAIVQRAFHWPEIRQIKH